MEKYKALVIENERNIPDEIKGFYMDNIELFDEEFEIVTYAKHRPELVIQTVITKDINAIVLASTFIDKRQLETTVNYFYNLNKPFTFFLYDAVDKLNEFIKTSCGRPELYNEFSNYNKFIKIIQEWVNKGVVFEITQDLCSTANIFDNNYKMGLEPRRLFIPSKVSFSTKYNMFFDTLRDENNNCSWKLKYIHK